MRRGETVRDEATRAISGRCFYAQLGESSVPRDAIRSQRVHLKWLRTLGARREQVTVAHGARSRRRGEKRHTKRPQFTTKRRIRARNTQPSDHAHKLTQRYRGRGHLVSYSCLRELKSWSACVVSVCGRRDGLKFRKCGQSGTEIKVAQAIPNQKQKIQIFL